MKKFFLTLALLISAIGFANAQTLEQSKFIDNTYVRVSGGATALTHPGCNGYEDWGHTIQAVIGAEVGKWITPKFGVAFAGDFGIRNGSKFGAFQYESIDPLKKAQKFNYITVTGLVKGNLGNIFCGYKNRPVDFVLATGPMWIHGFPGKNYINDFGVKFQAEVNVNVTNRVQVNFVPEFNYNLTGGYSRGTTKNPRFDARNSWYGMQVGVTYKFGKQFTVCPFQYTQGDIDHLNEQINELRSREPEVRTEYVEKVVTKEVCNEDQFIVLFDKNSYELNKTAKEVLDVIAKGTNVAIKAGASPEGSETHNQTLSENRANAVKNYLTNRGVNVKDVTAIGANLGSRVAIVTLK